MKQIQHKSKAKILSMSNQDARVYRVIGTTDIDSQGTLHDITDVDPIIFLDEAYIKIGADIPFKPHPHMGLVAMSYIINGEIKSWDNLQGDAEKTNQSGGVYYINSGNGIVHAETAVAGEPELHFLQMWFNPGIYQEPLPKAYSKLIDATTIPEIDTENYQARIVAGNAFAQQSPCHTDWPIQYLHIKLKPNSQEIFTLPENDWRGFIYIIQGEGVFGENKIQASSQDCLVFADDNETQLAISNDTEHTLEIIMVSGKPHNKAFYKLLGHGGALVTASKEQARQGMLRYESSPDDFGR